METKKTNREAKDLKEAEQKAKNTIKHLPIKTKPAGPVGGCGATSASK